MPTHTLTHVQTFIDILTIVLICLEYLCLFIVCTCIFPASLCCPQNAATAFKTLWPAFDEWIFLKIILLWILKFIYSAYVFPSPFPFLFPGGQLSFEELITELLLDCIWTFMIRFLSNLFWLIELNCSVWCRFHGPSLSFSDERIHRSQKIHFLLKLVTSQDEFW